MSSDRSMGGTDRDWEHVESVICDLKNDGYEVSEFKSNTSEPRVEKAFLLVVERSVQTDGDDSE